jgi:hypothetical protein
MLSFNISYSDLIKFHYFADTTERGDIGGVKERVTLRRTLLCLQWCQNRFPHENLSLDGEGFRTLGKNKKDRLLVGQRQRLATRLIAIDRLATYKCFLIVLSYSKTNMGNINTKLGFSEN